MFTLLSTSTKSKARLGVLHTAHGDIPTPIFMPVGTQATVKGLTPDVLEALDAKIILSNTYHLYLRPGNDVMEHFGGLHKFMHWNRPLLTDSGGFQVFSLQELRKLSEEGVHFKSHIDGSAHFFSPESVVDTQRIIGSDIMMVLDECVENPAKYSYVRKSIELSLKWAAASREHFLNTEPLWGFPQYQFGIGQGSMYKDLRQEYVERMVEIGFDGYALGGLSVGEATEQMYEVIDWCTDLLPADKPRYLMGVGTPANLLEGISRGIDMFDCVMPTRNARNGQIFTTRGKFNIRNARFKFCDEAIDPGLDSYASQNFTLGYLRHLVMSDEMLGVQLASMQNIAYYLWLMEQSRKHLADGTFEEFRSHCSTYL
ncbi:MAG: tRNA guanosine(34) transglycosylase Tgt [Ignavibacteria bacterium]|jgi:queuine tRNA-ribosyltransferase|nr:tRNA guanosine(34) transglycosylase Tgt [Ignavibacteria bacterium]